MRRKRRPPLWMIFLLFVGFVMIIAGLIMRCDDAQGADWTPRYNFSENLDTMYTCFYRNNVLDDSSFGRADTSTYETTFTYTTGEYIQSKLQYKFHADDKWATWTEDYYSSLTVGDGPYSVTFLTWDSTTDMAVPRVDLTIRPVDQSSHAADPITDASGYGTANLTADSFVVIEDVPGWTQDNTLDTFLVTGANDTFTVYMDQFSPDAPSGANFCTVYGYLTEARDALTTKVKFVEICFTPTETVRNSCDDTRIVSGPVCATTNANGIFQIDLVYSSCMLNDDGNEVQYKVTIEGEDGFTLITVPDADGYMIWTE